MIEDLDHFFKKKVGSDPICLIFSGVVLPPHAIQQDDADHETNEGSSELDIAVVHNAR